MQLVLKVMVRILIRFTFDYKVGIKAQDVLVKNNNYQCAYKINVRQYSTLTSLKSIIYSVSVRPCVYIFM